jgi:uncharacterized protein YndB with AHSA1/START domain
METLTVHDTFVLERSYAATPARVFSFFADPVRKRRWYAEGHGHEIETFDMVFEIGGVERSRYRMGPSTPLPGAILASDGAIQDIAPDRRVVIASTMSLGDQRISSSLLTIELVADGAGTKLTCTHQGVFYAGADGPQMRKGGWSLLLDKLGKALAE